MSRAYDADSGKLVWRFYTVPGNPADGPDNAASDEVFAKFAGKTWNGKYWEMGGGGTVWDSVVYDADFDQLLVGVGNGSPWNHRARSAGKGDNLFLASILALDPDTGKYKWHYQLNPGRKLGLHRHPADHPRRADHRREEAQGADAGARRTASST